MALVVLTVLTHLPWILFGLLAWAAWSMVVRGGGAAPLERTVAPPTGRGRTAPDAGGPATLRGPAVRPGGAGAPWRV